MKNPSSPPGRKPLLEAWQPASPKLRAAFASFKDQCATARLNPPSNLLASEEGVLDNARLQGVDAVVFADVSPHVDENFDRWFVFWTVKASGQTLHTKRAKVPTPGMSPTQSLSMEEGQMFILDAHHLHWTTTYPPLEGAADRKQRFSVMLVAETPIRPTHAQAEVLMEKALEARLSTYAEPFFEAVPAPVLARSSGHRAR